MKEEYYEMWNQIDYINNFGIGPDKGPDHLTKNKMVIPDKDRLKFYSKEMYES